MEVQIWIYSHQTRDWHSLKVVGQLKTATTNHQINWWATNEEYTCSVSLRRPRRRVSSNPLCWKVAFKATEKKKNRNTMRPKNRSKRKQTVTTVKRNWTCQKYMKCCNVKCMNIWEKLNTSYDKTVGSAYTPGVYRVEYKRILAWYQIHPNYRVSNSVL